MAKYPLEARQIYKNFGGVRALEDVSFYLDEGEVLGLIGDNGAGKSTLIKIIAGVYQPDHGDIYLDGTCVKLDDPKESKKQGIETVFQDLALFDQLTITRNLFVGRQMSNVFGICRDKDMKQRSREILDYLDMNVKSLDQKVFELSGGQKHAVAIGRTFVGRTPKLLLLDEPSAGLSVKASQNILSLIVHLKKQGMSIIFISHNLQSILETSSRILVLRSGRVAGELDPGQTSQRECINLMVGGGRTLND